MSKSISASERETIIRFDDSDKTAYIYTINPVYIRKLDKKCSQHPDEYKCVKQDAEYGAKYYSLPQALVRFGSPVHRSEAQRKADEESRKARTERMKAFNAARCAEKKEEE